MSMCIHCGAPRVDAAVEGRCPQCSEVPRPRPSFDRLSDLMPAIVAAAAAANVPAPALPPPIPRPRGQYVLMGVLTFGALLLAWLVISAPARAMGEDAARAEHAAQASHGATGAARAAVPDASAEHPRRSGRAGKAEKKPHERPGAKEVGPSPEALKEELEARRYSVECLLDRAKCPPSEPPPSAQPVVASEESLLPERLDLADISDGTRAARAAAVGRCKALARGGEVVKIKLSIAGPSGSVLRASPEDDAGNPRLAACCAEELAAASFKRVRKPQIGAVTTIKF